MTNTLASITTWHQRARPDPTHANLNVQLGCHVEEFCEMLECLVGNSQYADTVIGIAHAAAHDLADRLKEGSIKAVLPVDKRIDFLDSLADQIVTAVGVGHCSKMNVTDACVRVDDSNWSKFDEYGQPIFNANGKIMKGPGYAQPNLEGLC